ncbi:MAG: radical SAM protein [Candidatus Omnitrophica bacterium]|nr:radical SAM protein [Candidatus Omnitrophota bacterium]
MNHLYIVRLPHDSKYDEMLRSQGYLDYIYYLKRNAIGATLIDLRDQAGIGAIKGIPQRARVVIAVLRTSQIRSGLKVAQYLKRHKKAVIIFGRLINYGAFSTPYLDCSRHRFVDYVIPAKCSEMAVLRYLQGDASFLIKNAVGQKVPENNAPEISISDLKTSKTAHRHKFLTYELSRGCPNRCYYCVNSLSGFQYKKITQVISEIRRLAKINKTKKIVFVGPEINFNNDYLAKLLSKLILLNVRWTSYAVPRALDKAMLKLMKKAGCRLLSLGLESANQNTLDVIGKKIQIDEVARIVQDCHKIGIRTQIHIIVGFPYETAEDIGELKQFIRRNKRAITNVNISNLDIPKDSRIGRDPDAFGIILDGAQDGEFFSFHEKGRPQGKKRAEISARIKGLDLFIKGLGLSCFTTSTPFDESFEKLYLNSLDIRDSI